MYNKNTHFKFGFNEFGSVHFFNGFHFYQYGMKDDNISATTHDALLDANQNIKAARAGDTKRFSYPLPSINCDVVDPQSRHIQVKEEYIDNSASNTILAVVEPNPFSKSAILKLKSAEKFKVQKFEIKNNVGQNADNLFEVEFDKMQNIFKVKAVQKINGVYTFSILLTNGHNVNSKLIVLQ